MSAGTSPVSATAPGGGAAPGVDGGLLRLEVARKRMLAGLVALPAEMSASRTRWAVCWRRTGFAG